MSLINDALQRAKQAQQVNPPTVHNLELRPLENTRRQSRGLPGWLLPMGFVAIGVVGILLFWSLNRKPVAARQQTPENPIVVARAPVELPPATPAVPTPAPAPPSSMSISTPSTPDSANTATNLADITAEAPPSKPPPLKLQAILFSEVRPSAYIGGKILFIGGKVRDFRVTAITSETVTLVSDTETNVLTLE